MLTIWGRTNSVNVKKVLWCAEELGLTYERKEAGGLFGLVDEPSFLALNPNGLVPLIEDDGLVLWESNTIVRYFAAKYGTPAFWPSDPATRASGEKWMDWATSTLAGPFRNVFWPMVRAAPEERDMARIEENVSTCSRLLGIVDKALADQPYLSGEAFGAADIPLGCFAYGWYGMAIERPDLPHLKAWYDRLTERPAYRQAVMIPLT